METIFITNAALALSTTGGDLWKMAKGMGPVVKAVMILLVLMSVVTLSNDANVPSPPPD